MLAQLFEQERIRLQELADERTQEQAERDAQIVVNFPLLDGQFSNSITAVTGTHMNLAVIKTTLTDTFTSHTFSSLNKTRVQVRSTLYGKIEEVVFTPALESIDSLQFGVIKVELAGLKPVFNEPDSTRLYESILKRGILMRGEESAELVIAEGATNVALTDELLEGFLAALFIRSS